MRADANTDIPDMVGNPYSPLPLPLSISNGESAARAGDEPSASALASPAASRRTLAVTCPRLRCPMKQDMPSREAIC